MRFVIIIVQTPGNCKANPVHAANTGLQKHGESKKEPVSDSRTHDSFLLTVILFIFPGQNDL